MDATQTTDAAVSRVAAAIGEPARTRMLFCLMDGLARTSTELSVVGKVTPATASVHLNRLRAEKLIIVQVQGRHRYYRLAGANVARAVECLSVVAGNSISKFKPSTPDRLRTARTCYDHMAGTVAVRLHDLFLTSRWVTPISVEHRTEYEMTVHGTTLLRDLDIDGDAVRRMRRRFAYGCLDWSERRLHFGGALGAALLDRMLAKRWVSRDLDSRAISVTASGRREFKNLLGLEI